MPEDTSFVGAGKGISVNTETLRNDTRIAAMTTDTRICLSISLRSTQHVVGHGLNAGADPQQRLECRHRRAAAVEAERELVEVRLQMLR